MYVSAVQETIIPDIFADQHFANFKLRNGSFSTQLQISPELDGVAIWLAVFLQVLALPSGSL